MVKRGRKNEPGRKGTRPTGEGFGEVWGETAQKQIHGGELGKGGGVATHRDQHPSAWPKFFIVGDTGIGVLGLGLRKELAGPRHAGDGKRNMGKGWLLGAMTGGLTSAKKEFVGASGAEKTFYPKPTTARGVNKLQPVGMNIREQKKGKKPGGRFANTQTRQKK